VKRYVVFAYGDYYPSGGWNDHIGSYDTLEQAQQAARHAREVGRFDFTDIIDLVTGENNDD
jgi:hypothetical protein